METKIINKKQTMDAMADLSEIGPVAFGPIPRPSVFSRWAQVVEVDLESLPPVKTWECRRVDTSIQIDGCLDEEAWATANWSDPFGLITNGSPVPLDTRVAFLWDAQYLYVGYKVEDPDVRGTMTGFNDHVYVQDEDVEFFFEGDGYYYELGVNPINTTYQIRWTWVERLVREQRFSEIEELFKTPDVLYYLARPNEKLGRHANLSYQLPGLLNAVHVDGSVNCPHSPDRGWTVEFAIPWNGLREMRTDRILQPKAGDVFRMTAYRAHHDRSTGKVKGWTWSIMGNDNIHIPERWNKVKLV